MFVLEDKRRWSWEAWIWSTLEAEERTGPTPYEYELPWRTIGMRVVAEEDEVEIKGGCGACGGGRVYEGGAAAAGLVMLFREERGDCAAKGGDRGEMVVMIGSMAVEFDAADDDGGGLAKLTALTAALSRTSPLGRSRTKLPWGLICLFSSARDVVTLLALGKGLELEKLLLRLGFLREDFRGREFALRRCWSPCF